METLWLLPLFAVILFVAVPQVFKFYVFYSPYQNFGFVAVKFWFLVVFKFSFEFKINKIVIRTGKKTIDVEYALSDPTLKFYGDLSKEIQDKIKLKSFDFYSKIGTGDAASTALWTGFMAALAKAVCSKMKTSKPTANININAYSEFKRRIFEVSLYSKVSLSIFEFLYSVLMAWFMQKNT